MAWELQVPSSRATGIGPDMAEQLAALSLLPVLQRYVPLCAMLGSRSSVRCS